MECLDEYIMKNPYLYIELVYSEQNGYLIQEDNRLIYLEDNVNDNSILFY